jgi:PKD repeat protein
MMKRIVIPLALWAVLVVAFLVAPVTAAGLNITEGKVVTTVHGTTSPLITITESDIAPGGTITLEIYYVKGFFASGTLSDENIVVTSNATAATWTGAVAGDFLTLTSTGGTTLVGETINVTFKGTAGNPWYPYSGGGLLGYPVTATRSDGYDPESFNIAVDMVTPVPTGLNIANGTPITTTTGSTSPVITITDTPIAKGGNITILVPFIPSYIASSNFNDANVVINDTAANANWTRTVTGDRVILTSTGGPTAVGETVTVTFTGAANPWIISLTVGTEYPYITAVRGDELGAGYFTLAISTPDPTDLIIAEGAKINTTTGTSSPVITLTGTDIVPEGTIILDVTNLYSYVAGGKFTAENVVISDTAANATWTGTVHFYQLILTSTGGPTVGGENITVTFTGAVNPWIANTNGEQILTIYVQRGDGGGLGLFNFVIETTPPPGSMVVANFTATPTSDMAPLTVAFTDTSLASPTSWSWDINNDGVEDYTTQNPVHTYADVGIYTVSLTATNVYGSDTKTRWDYIRVLNSAVMEANTSINGLTITNCGGPQTITVNISILPAVSITNSVMEIQPPADRGFKTILINAPSNVGFSQEGTLITGTPTSVHLVTEELAFPSGFSSHIGTNASLNVSMDLPSYPCNAILSTKIWDGVIPEYDNKFRWIASNNSAFPVGTAYTANFTRINFPNATNVKVHMSVDSSWSSKLGGERVLIWRIADDGNSGQILPTTYLYSDPVNNLNYYEAESPLGMSTFGISSLTGSNNPFQLVAFVAAAVINQPDNPGPASVASGGGGTAVAVHATSAPETQQATPTDPGKTAKIYANDEGTITQAMTLKSTDGLANVSLGLGIVARNSSGMPLTSISITRIADLPAALPGDGLSFAGMAYEIKPDGATFSPAIPLSFTIPQGQWGKEYVMQAYDHATGTWQSLPGSYDPQTGTMTVQFSHLCCFALFAKSTELQKAENPGPTLVVTPEKTIIVSSKSPLSTNFEMYGWILSMIVNNPVTLVIMLAALAMVAYFGWWKRRL